MSQGVGGLLDFVGYPTGSAGGALPPAVIPGFYGLLDFVGYPVGSVGGAVPAKGKPKGLFGREMMARYLLAEQIQISLLDNQEENFQQHILLKLVNRVAEQWHDYQTDLAKARDNAIFATILAEV